jgi:hypothetical protein
VAIESTVSFIKREKRIELLKRKKADDPLGVKTRGLKNPLVFWLLDNRLFVLCP